MLISVPDARKLLTANVVNWGDEVVPLARAGGRTLRETVVADRDQPAFDRVAMDGIALSYASYAAGQRFFPVARLQAAGDVPQLLTDPTQCVEIMTGAALPPGTTTVIRYEDLRREGNGFHLPEDVRDATNIHYRGKDVAEGTDLLEPGRAIGVGETGMLATCGYAEVRVSKLPRVAVIATGNELVPVTADPEPHQIRRSNYYQLRELLRPLGVDATLYHLVDDRALLTRELTKILAEYDVLILSGGVSKGKLDFVPEVLTDLGVERLFHGVAQRPGKPLWAGRTADKMVFGLPGNPVSSVSCTIHYVLPWLRMGLGLAERPPVFAQLTEEVVFKPDLTLYARVALRSDPATGELLAIPVRHAGSGDGRSLTRSHAFAELGGAEVFPVGTVVRVRSID
ncbi:MAG: molybdopterin molybdotransferase MoeA [Bacteroidota bacterium]